MLVDNDRLLPNTSLLSIRTRWFLLELDGDGGNYYRPVQRAGETKLGSLGMRREYGLRGRDVRRAHLELRFPMAPTPTTTSSFRIATGEIIRGGGGGVSNGRGGLARGFSMTAASPAAHTLAKAWHYPLSRVELSNRKMTRDGLDKSSGSIREQGSLKGVQREFSQSRGICIEQIDPQSAERALRNVKTGCNFNTTDNGTASPHAGSRAGLCNNRGVA